MSAAPHFSATWPAVSRILDHCSSLDRVRVEERATALARLESELGGEVARRLVGALSGRDGRLPARVSL